MTKNRPQSRPDVPWATRQEIPDWQIVDAADQYEDACRLLSKQPPGSGVVLPLINSAALSIELYLKSFSAERIYTASPHVPEVSVVTAYAKNTGHELKKLFEAISDEIRAKLAAAYDAELRSELNGDLATALEKIEGALVASRYPFELDANVDRYSLPHLIGIAKFLRAFVRSMPGKEIIKRP